MPLCRRNLSELDDIQRYFSSKLSTPTFPSLSQREGGSSAPQQRQVEHSDSDADAQQLLLKSSRLVGEVNSIISGEWPSQQKHTAISTLSQSLQLEVFLQDVQPGADWVFLKLHVEARWRVHILTSTVLYTECICPVFIVFVSPSNFPFFPSMNPFFCASFLHFRSE